MSPSKADTRCPTGGVVSAVRGAAFLCLVVDLVALGAHLVELPNKLAMSGALWLQVQQTLYRGWGPVLGPFEVGALIFAWLLVYLLRRRRAVLALTLAAAICLTVSLGLFFLFVQPVNLAFATWSPETMPADWAAYRLSWEYGHAARAVLAAAAMAALIRAALIDRGTTRLPSGTSRGHSEAP